MPYEFYKVLHLIAIFAVLLPLGGITLHVMNGGTRDHKLRRWAALWHGLGLFVVLVAGFGLLARLYSGNPWPGWIYAKIVIWLLFGLAPMAIYCRPQFARGIWTALLALGALAAYLAIYKPF